jgi:hypothetical protein
MQLLGEKTTNKEHFQAISLTISDSLIYRKRTNLPNILYNTVKTGFTLKAIYKNKTAFTQDKKINMHKITILPHISFGFIYH